MMKITITISILVVSVALLLGESLYFTAFHCGLFFTLLLKAYI